MCLNLFSSKNTISSQENDQEIVFPYQFYQGWYFPVIKFYMAKNTQSAPVLMTALVDSGANLSIFNQEAASALGIVMSQGARRRFSGIGSDSFGYEHTVYFDVSGVKFKDEVIFSSNMNAYFNLIGRESFFNQFAKVSFDENKRETILVKK